MSANHLIYYVLLTTATVLSFFRIQHDRRLLVFALLLLFSLVEELLFEYLEWRTGRSFFFIYHLYAPFYYGLFGWYYYLYISHRLTKVLLLLSIFLFAVVSCYLSFYQKTYNQFPGLQINIIGVLLIIFSLVVLFTVDIRVKLPLHNRPLFWTGLSTLIFYCGLFFVNGAYSYLLKNNEVLAKRLNELINNNLNFLYYFLIIIGLLCSKPIAKYSSRSS